MLTDWEGIANKVAKAIVGEKMIVCCRASRRWDDEVKAIIEHRREVIGRLLMARRSCGKSITKRD